MVSSETPHDWLNDLVIPDLLKTVSPSCAVLGHGSSLNQMHTCQLLRFKKSASRKSVSPWCDGPITHKHGLSCCEGRQPATACMHRTREQQLRGVFFDIVPNASSSLLYQCWLRGRGGGGRGGRGKTLTVRWIKEPSVFKSSNMNWKCSCSCAVVCFIYSWGGGGDWRWK